MHRPLGSGPTLDRWGDSTDSERLRPMPLRARNKLVVDHLHIVGMVTSSVVARIGHTVRDDLVSAGAVALVRAADSFDASLGVPFGAFAQRRVRWALMDELRSLDWAPREVRARATQTTSVRDDLAASWGRTPTVAEISRAMGVSTAEVREGLADAGRVVISLDAPDLVDVAGDDVLPEERAISSERDELLHRAIAGLPDRKALIVRSIYFDGRTVTDVAEELGVSHAAVSQQRSAAVRMLRDVLDRHESDLRPLPLAARTRSATPRAREVFATAGARFTRAVVADALGA